MFTVGCMRDHPHVGKVNSRAKLRGRAEHFYKIKVQNGKVKGSHRAFDPRLLTFPTVAVYDFIFRIQLMKNR